MKTEIYAGEDILSIIPDLADLRITIFAEYPYLYRGSVESEAKYLRHYAKFPDGRILILRDDSNAVAGAATGIPLNGWGGSNAHEAFAPYPPEAIYYYGEILLRKPFRGNGWGKKLCLTGFDCFKAMGYPYMGLLMVERAKDDPRKPAGYRPMDGFTLELGFEKIPGGQFTESWPGPDGQNSENTLQAWIQKL